MKKYTAGQRAPYGVYASVWPPNMCVVSADGEPIHGKEGTTYRRIPLLLVIAAGPAIGGAFVLSFPLIVVAAVFTAIAQRVFRGATELGDSQAHLVRLRWEPATSYLQHTDDEADTAEAVAEPAAEDELGELAEEVRARRERETR